MEFCIFILLYTKIYIYEFIIQGTLKLDVKSYLAPVNGRR